MYNIFFFVFYARQKKVHCLFSVVLLCINYSSHRSHFQTRQLSVLVRS